MHAQFVTMAFLDKQSIQSWDTEGELGIAILSSHPFLKLEIHYIHLDSNPRILRNPTDYSRAVLFIEYLIHGVQYPVATTHFTYSATGANTPEQAADLQKLLDSLSGKEELILCGDFNIPRGTPLFEKITREFTSHVPGSYKSSLDPLLFRNPAVEFVVDHLFTRGHFFADEVRLVQGLSDHQGIVANLFYDEEVQFGRIANF